MKIAVITPYFRESAAQLKRCHDSVLAQTIPCHHVFVSDGDPHPMIDTFDATHIRLPNHGDYGDTPRMVGCAHAGSAGYDALLLLDADNYFDPDHVEKLVAFQKRSGAAVVTCARTLIHCETGAAIGACVESDGVTFVDTNCYLITRSAFPYCAGWGFKDKAHGIIGDRIFFNALKSAGVAMAHSPENGVNYVTTFAFHYLNLKLEPPPGAKVIVDTGKGGYIMGKFTDYFDRLVAAAQAAKG